MLGADDEQRKLVDALLLERPDHVAKRFVGFIQSVGEDFGRRPGAVDVTACLAIEAARFGQLPSLFSLDSFCPTLTAWKFIPNRVGVRLSGKSSCVRP